MYLLSLEADEKLFVQGAVDVELLSFSEEANRKEWWVRLHFLLRSIDLLENEGLTIRIYLSDNCSLKLCIFVWVKDENVSFLEQYLISFSELNLILPGSVFYPTSRDEYYEMLMSFPEYRERINISGFNSENVSFLCNFRILPLLEDIFKKASFNRIPFGYQINFQPYYVGSELLKTAKKNLLRMENISGIPERVVSVQRELVENLPEQNMAVEEFVGTNELDDTYYISNILTSHFRQKFGPLGFDDPELNFSTMVYEHSLDWGRHSITFSELPWDEICGSMVDHAARDKLFELISDPNIRITSFKYKSTNSSLSNNKQYVGSDEHVQNKQTILEFPLPYQGIDDFIFMSYGHQDEKRIIPIIQNITKWGYNIWWDKGIPGGAEWDTLIEEKIENCQLILLFLSESSVNSKFLRREVKFADLIGKSVLCVDLDSSRYSHGMKMLLSQYQRISFSNLEFYQNLKNGIEYLIDNQRIV